MPESKTDYWSSRYLQDNTPWDMGTASPPLTAFLQQLTNKDQRILIPGAGNSYEAEWLWNNGFKNTFVLDISLLPLQNLKERVPQIPDNHLLHEDFFRHEENYDLIVEQTFFCALPPDQRKEYVKKTFELLKPGGQLFGVLFDFPLTSVGPPYGGSSGEYRQLFSQLFKIYRLDRCYKSIKPRQGSELFFRTIKHG